MSPFPLMLSLLVPARAFAPVVAGQVPTVSPPGEPRIQYEHPQLQARFLRSEAWQRFAATDGAGWSARFDESTGTPRWLWGRGVTVPTGSGDEVAGAVQAILERHRELFGFEEGSLVLSKSSYNAAFDTWYVSWNTLRDGIAPFRSGLSARVEHGRLVLITAATDPTAELRGSFALSAADALRLAIAAGPAPTGVHTDTSAERALVEILDPTGLHLQRAWLVRSRTVEPPGRWVTLVDASSGDVLRADNEVRFASGSVSAYHHERTVDGTPSVLDPLPLVGVDGDVDSTVTDADGLYTLTDSATYATAFVGDYLTIDNDDGVDAVLESSAADLVWEEGDMTPAEPQTWLAVHHVRDWAQAIDPTLPIVVGPLNAIVNIKQNCNAYYDGSLHFFHTGGGCNNTGEIADVVYHEWGHGFHESSLEAGVLDPNVGEAVGDTVAFLQTNDHAIGPYFFDDGAPVRDVDPDMVYPDDFRKPELIFSHENGLIFGGAMWDLLGLMQAKYGVDEGTDVTSRLLAGLLKGGPDLVGTYYEILVADDDDGDLENGTPNQCDIMDAFGRHGLVQFTMAATHEPLVDAVADQPTTIQVQVVSTTGACATSSAVSAVVHYRVDGGDWLEAPATISGGDLTGEIPGQPLGAFVEYYLDGVDSLGVGFSTPQSGEVAPYTYFSGDVIEVHCDDFEADDGGFTHSLLEGTPEAGADDWEWGTPTGLAGDPPLAYSGNKVWGNDLGVDGAYLSGKTNYLVGPSIPTGHFTDVFLQYRRWLGVEDASYDQAMILANDELVWTNYDGSGFQETSDEQWISHSVDLGHRGDRGEVKVGFGMRSDLGLEMGGWTIDDVCLYAPASADNRLGIDDFAATDAGGPIELSWTNPNHGPVTQVVVVKRADRYPDGHEDGVVVATVDAPTAGAAVTVEDANDDGSAGFYAAYATDGTSWASYTVEGLNADFAEPNGGGTGTSVSSTASGPGADDPKGEAGGCGCAATPSAAGWLAVPMIGLLARRRRRSAR